MTERPPHKGQTPRPAAGGGNKPRPRAPAVRLPRGKDLPRLPRPKRAGSGSSRSSSPIVPAGNIAGRALVFVIAIMTFLSCLTLGGVALVRDTASTWQSQISREATIQIRPADGFDIEAALVKARDIAGAFDGVEDASVVDTDATARLLEPWLGSGFDINELPVPRLVIVTIDENDPPDFAAMRKALAVVPHLTLDDHRTWVDRLVSMAHTTVAIGISILALMLSTTVLTVVFATRGAMAGNHHIIEVLHFVGAEARFIAAEFRHRFLLIGLKGAAAGGALAVLVFLGFSWWSARNLATPEADQATALFGNFSIGLDGYLGVGVIMILVAFLTGATSHMTVLAHLAQIDTASGESA